ncbi:MSC_0882 family membrane protein [Mycoplasmopsis opalescens]|uniref:MSC_0882 family membrane protein n=1 Tax=Mycoplasmopsis opalescens TaxID=114886 RepID=UPI0004A74842|nr:hypothetical protein [Mycoplasmopsis opalescens]
MAKYTPINDIDTVEVIQNNHSIDLESKAKKTYNDPKNQISPRVYRVIFAEKLIKNLIILFYSILFVSSLLIFTLTYFNIGVFKNNYLSYKIIFGTLSVIFLLLLIKHAIDKLKWKHAEQRYRNALESGDYMSDTTFYLAYRNITLKGVNLTWYLIFILTYMSVITGIIYGIYSIGKINISYDGEFGNRIQLTYDIPAVLNKAFGDTTIFSLIMVLVMIGITLLYITLKLIDRKRLSDFSDLLGEKAIEIHSQVERAKKERNSIWIKVYFVIVTLTILIPLALIIIAIWRFIVKKRAKIVKVQ